MTVEEVKATTERWKEVRSKLRAMGMETERMESKIIDADTNFGKIKQGELQEIIKAHGCSTLRELKNSFKPTRWERGDRGRTIPQHNDGRTANADDVSRGTGATTGTEGIHPRRREKSQRDPGEKTYEQHGVRKLVKLPNSIHTVTQVTAYMP